MKIQDLSLQKGITLSIQQIEILNIVAASNIMELKETIKDLYNLNYQMALKEIETNDFLSAKKHIVIQYKQSLLPSYTNFQLNSEQIIKKHLKKQVCLFTDNSDMAKIILEALKYNSIIECLVMLKNNLDAETYKMFSKFLANFHTIETTGLKATPYEDFEKLLVLLQNYDIINVNDVINYNSYVQPDTYNNLSLLKALNFAYKHNKKIRIGSLISYADMPKWLINEQNTQINKNYINQQLSLYVHDVVNCIKTYEREKQKHIIDAIILLNEPLESEINGKDYFLRHYSIFDNIFKKQTNRL